MNQIHLCGPETKHAEKMGTFRQFFRLNLLLVFDIGYILYHKEI